MILKQLHNQPKWYINKNWKIKTQILIASLIVYLIIFSILLSAVLISQHYLHKMLTLFSNQIFLKHSKSLLRYQGLYKRGLELNLLHTAQQVSLVRDFNQLFDSHLTNHSFQVKEYPRMCLNDPKQNDSYCYMGSVSCGLFGQPQNNIQNLKVQSILQTTEVLTSYKYTLDTKNPIYYFNNNQTTQLYCITVGLKFPNTFNPLKRQYYLDHLNYSANATNPKAIYIVNPYTIITNAINFPMTTNLLDKTDKVIGIIVNGIDLDYATLSKFSGNDTQILIIDKHGKVLLSELYNIHSQPMYYLNQSEYSGFDNLDLQQILLHHYQQEFINNCSNIISTNILCRFNSIIQDSLIIETKNISNSPFIMVILLKTNFILNQEVQYIEILASIFQDDIQNSLILSFAIPVFILFCSQLLINFILKQLNSIIFDVKAYLFSNKREYLMKQLFKTNTFILSNTIIDFQTAIVNLFQHQVTFKKSQECIEMEKIEYPIHNKLYKLLASKLEYIVNKKRLKNNYILSSIQLSQLKQLILR